MSITPETEIKRVIARLQSLEHELAPSTILDKGDAKILLDYVELLESHSHAESHLKTYHLYKGL